ncbi:hypothetical protein GCM10011391_20450 [Pullulanibacillus camelliae]|uniref:N-acetyltransferase domain-containing protein n=1 Tax=Pullulanibacillus camelliae TaxID=1707096 RepID=A0A8J2YFD0_9BACL|nr:GNAT family N-acetyltransferase [Pullulanibacillus camelliae]GGE41595.1 hypothetical protein GCM10011391_20450 [Pullulanibacillus camelliae]
MPVFKFIPIDQEYLKQHLADFIRIKNDQALDYWEESHFLQDREGKWAYSLALEEQGQLRGYIIASVDHSQLTVHIHKFMMAPEVRGKGYGTQLFRAFLRRLSSAPYRDISLKVHESNRAKHLYERLGFITLDDRSEYHFMKREHQSMGQGTDQP